MLGLLNSALLWALAAVAVPVLIHFLTRRKLRVVAVSTIAFLKRLEREKIRQLKLRQLLLLLLRMLIVALLVLAFTRPTLRRSSAAPAQRAHTTTVIVVDNSLSMAAATQGVSLLAQARQQAQTLAAMFSSGDELHLITASRSAREVAGSPFLDPERLHESLGALPQTWAATDFAGAFALARRVLERSRNANRELYLISDCRGPLPPALPALPGVRGYVMRLEPGSTENLTLAGVTLANQIFERGRSFEVVASVANTGDRDTGNELIHLYLNGKRVAQQSVTVPPGSQRSVTFRAVPDTTGFVTGRVVLDDDDLLLDNTRYFNLYIPARRRVLAVAERSADLIFVRAAIHGNGATDPASGPTQTWKEIETRHLAAEPFPEYDAILLANVARLPEGVPERLIDFLRSGGGVILFPGSEMDLRHYNEAFFSRIGFGAFGETMGSLTGRDDFITLAQIDFSHPLFAGMFERSEQAPVVESPLFRFAVQLRPAAGTRSLIAFANAYPFLVERRVDGGRLLVFACSADARWSDFAFRGLFAPLLHRGLAYVTQNTDPQMEAFTVGRELTALLRVPAEAPQVELPTGERVQVPVQVVGQNYQVKVPEVTMPGFHSLFNRDQMLQQWAVNFDARETQAESLTLDQIAAASGAANCVELPRDGDLQASIASARYGVELWHWFLIAALVAMVVEMLLYRSGPAGREEQAGVPAGHVVSNRS